jgi:hypothetical protein
LADPLTRVAKRVFQIAGICGQFLLTEFCQFLILEQVSWAVVITELIRHAGYVDTFRVECKELALDTSVLSGIDQGGITV